MEKSCQVSISQRRAVVCLYSSFTHISSEFLSLPAWGESLIGEGPCPRVKWHREAGSEYCPLPSSWASTVLSFQGLLSQPPRKKGKGAKVTAGPYDRADKLSVVTQCQFSSALTRFIWIFFFFLINENWKNSRKFKVSYLPKVKCQDVEVCYFVATAEHAVFQWRS